MNRYIILMIPVTTYYPYCLKTSEKSYFSRCQPYPLSYMRQTIIDNYMTASPTVPPCFIAAKRLYHDHGAHPGGY